MAAGVVVAGVVVAGAVVVAPTTVVAVSAGVAADSRFGRRNHTRLAVTTITASDASTAMTTSRRSRGGLHPVLLLPRVFGLIASSPYR